MKIVITGALGYLGTELCNLLSGEARYKNIVCIDNRFLSARVEQLRNWGMIFIHGSILDQDLMKIHLQDADIVYHLAGITDVAYTSTQSNPVQDELIRSVGIDGTQNILRYISSTCKIIFPSTHVVFEGLPETTFDITEEDPNAPRLTYAVGKLISESDIQMRRLVNNNYIIVRLGSVYGYSVDNMRINIMPNLFSKITSQDGTIPLYGGGVQYKSLVNVQDVVRAVKHLADGPYTGTYHLCNENMTVKQVAEICKKINPVVVLQETQDEIPNKGYTLSNKKLLDTGFKFLYNIHDSIRDMIIRWSVKPQPTALEYINQGGNEYRDTRGIIRNYELTEPINLIGYIESKQDTVRANHYHPIQEQKCLLISGRYVSVIKDLAYPDAPVEYKVIRPGDIAIIRPNVVHAMVFLQDSVFLNLVRGEREHNNYGITHTIPYILVDSTLRDSILSSYTTRCRVCGNTHLQGVVDLGMSPLANNLLDSADQHCDMYPLELEYCSECYNAQLSIVVPAPEMFDNYLYVSSTSPVFRKHFEDAAARYIQEFNLTSDSLVLDIGSNDGVFLKPLKEQGIKVIGVEPAKNLCDIANKSGIPTAHGYFNMAMQDRIYHEYGSPDIITASNVFAHADDLRGITEAIFLLMKPDGTFIIEVQYLLDTIRDMTFDNIYHEHVNYWSVTALANFFDTLGLCMFHVEHIDTHGGSIRCFIGKETRDNPSVQEYLNKELAQGVNSISTFLDFGNRVSAIKKQVQSNMKLLQGIVVCGYGSPAKATTSLNYYSITSKNILYTIEDNTMKNSKWIPGTGIQIWELDDIYKIPDFPEVCIILAWNFFDSIKKKLPLGITAISIKDLQLPEWEFRKLIDPTYKPTVSEWLQDYRQQYSHYLEDNVPDGSYIKILPYLQDIQNGFFVEAGAHNGSLASNSNTKILEDCGWSGLLIEPSTDLFRQLQTNRPNCILERTALVAFDHIGDKITDVAISVMGPTDTIYPANTFTDVAEWNSITHIDFFALDVEGYEMNVLHGIDFNSIHITWFLIECNTDKYSYDSLIEFMTEKGYSPIGNISNFTTENTPSWPSTHQDYLFKKN